MVTVDPIVSKDLLSNDRSLLGTSSHRETEGIKISSERLRICNVAELSIALFGEPEDRCETL